VASARSRGQRGRDQGSARYWLVQAGGGGGGRLQGKAALQPLASPHNEASKLGWSGAANHAGAQSDWGKSGQATGESYLGASWQQSKLGQAFLIWQSVSTDLQLPGRSQAAGGLQTKKLLTSFYGLEWNVALKRLWHWPLVDMCTAVTALKCRGV